MRIDKADLMAAAEGIVTSGQAASIWTALERRTPPAHVSALARVVYHIGGLVILAAMFACLWTSHSVFGPQSLTYIALAYALLFILVGWWLRRMPVTRIPSDILITLAVCMIGVAAANIQFYLTDPGFVTLDLFDSPSPAPRWPWVEVTVLIAGAMAFWAWTIPLVTAPMAVAMWSIFLRGYPGYVFGDDGHIDSLVFGSAALLTGCLIDRLTAKDNAFWIDLIGTLAFFSGLFILMDRDAWHEAIFCMSSLALMFLSVLWQRRIMVICGVIGVFIYCGSLWKRVFIDDRMFPIALALLGCAIILLGVLYHRCHASLEARIRSWLPAWMRTLTPRNR